MPGRDDSDLQLRNVKQNSVILNSCWRYTEMIAWHSCWHLQLILALSLIVSRVTALHVAKTPHSGTWKPLWGRAQTTHNKTKTQRRKFTIIYPRSCPVYFSCLTFPYSSLIEVQLSNQLERMAPWTNEIRVGGMWRCLWEAVIGVMVRHNRRRATIHWGCMVFYLQ